MSGIESVAEEYTRRWDESVEQHSDQYIPEKYQLGIIAEYLRSEGVEFTTEARVFSYPIDILALDDGDTVAIEMKSKDVTRGIEQARRDADVVDYSYLAVWEDRVTEDLVERVEDLSIGLMSIDESVTVLSEADTIAQQLCRKEQIVQKVVPDVRNHSAVQEHE